MDSSPTLILRHVSFLDSALGTGDLNYLGGGSGPAGPGALLGGGFYARALMAGVFAVNGGNSVVTASST